MKKKRHFARSTACFAAAFMAPASLYAAPITKSATGTDLTLGASWGGTAPGTGDIATWTTTSLGAGLTAATSVNWGSINVSGALTDIAISGAGTINTGNVSVSGIRALTIANLVALSSNGLYTIANVNGSTAVDTTLSGVLSGAFSLTKAGAGTLLLSNVANTFSGPVVINEGELQVSVGTAASGTVTTLGTGAITANSGTTLRLLAGSTANQYTYTNALTLNNATLAFQDGNHVLTGGMTLTGANVVTGVWAGKNLSVPGVISGTGSLNKTITPGQDAVLLLQGANTYSGGTTVTGGTLTLDFTSAAAPVNNILLQTGAMTLAGGNLTMAGKASVTNAQTLAGVSLAANTASTLTVTSGAGGSATLNLGAITRALNSSLNVVSTGTITTTSGSASSVLTDSSTGAAYATVGGTDWAAKDAANSSIVGLSSLGGYTAFDVGTVTLTGNADLVPAALPLTAGTFTLGAASSPSTIRNIAIAGNTLALGGFTLNTGGILSNVGLTISGAGSLQPATAGGELVLNQTANTTTISANLSNNTTASSITKTGTGTVAVSGAQSYTGATNILQGTFQIGSAPSLSGTATLSTSGFNVALGATLNLGNGTLSATQSITGAGNFVKGGNFITNGTINGSTNNYTGSTSVTVGTLTLGAGTVINGTSSVSISGGNNAVLTSNGSVTTLGAVTVSGGTSVAAGIYNNGNTAGTTPGTLNAASLTLNAANGQTSGPAHGGTFTNNANSTATFAGAITVNGQGSATAGVTSSANGSLFTNAGTVTAATLTLNNSPVTNTVSNKGGTYTQTGGTTTLTALNLVAVNSTLPGAVGNDTAVNLSGGTLTTVNGSMNGVTTVSGTGVLNVSGQFFMGDTAATRSGNVVQTGGTVNLTTTTASNIRIGHWATGTSTYGLSGGTLNATGSNTVLGYDGNAVFNLSGTGVANLRGIQINRGFGGTGILNLTGGRLNLGVGGITFVAGTGAASTINLGAGTVGALGNWTSALAMSLTDPAAGVTFNTLDAADSTTARTITLNGVLSGPGDLTKAGAGTLVLTGNNTLTGTAAVDGGTLSAASTTGKALGTTSGVFLNGGELLLGSADQINDSAPLSLAGGRFSTGGFNETAGVVTMTASSVIDLGSGSSALQFASSSGLWSGVLSIWNYTPGPDQISFGTDSTALAPAQLSQVEFYSGSGSGFLGNATFASGGQIVPVPEIAPLTGFAGFLAWLGFRRRRGHTAVC